jgi:hypothetical protein
LFIVRQLIERAAQVAGFVASTTRDTVPERGWNDDAAVINLALPRAMRRFRMRRLFTDTESP